MTLAFAVELQGIEAEIGEWGYLSLFYSTLITVLYVSKIK